ncbi:hypothetical protein J1614_010923 [Plenodomus biglobosus]|nr:hypothetical protein J1614_010923 [Plenodomus biglobosus]
MATFLYSPMSTGTGTSFSFVERASVCDFVHLSDALEVDHDQASKEQDYFDSQAMYTPQENTYYPSTSLQSPSEPPTASFQLQQSNLRLLELLESVQGELGKQRALMRDIQTRVSTLEQESNSNTVTRVQSMATPTKTISPIRSKQPSSNLPLESRTWWEACQNFAHNCDTPFNVTEFLATPRRFSGLDFDFNFDNDEDDAHTIVAPPAAPVPELTDVPGLTPEPEEDDMTMYIFPETRPATALSPRADTGAVAVIRRPRAVTFPCVHASDIKTETETDILERIVEVSRFKMPRPPMLQSPPRSVKSSASVAALEDSNEDITALPVMPPREPTPVESVRKGGHGKMKSLLLGRTLLKGRAGCRRD